MENISHSLPKRSFVSNSNGGFTSHKSVYDDVFGGPPKFGLPTLSPRLEDYAEIFGGFHTSRSSSIPVIDIPVIGDQLELHFDARSPGFNYAEVFGDYTGLDWTTSFEDITGQSSGGYDSSDEPWSPAQSGSLSDELDPLARSDKSHKLSDDDSHQSLERSDKSHKLSDDDSHQSLESNREFNVSYNKSSQRIMETVLAGTSHVTKYDAVSLNGEDEYCTIHVADDINCSKDFGGKVPQEKQYKNCLSNPLESGIGTHGNPSEKDANCPSPLDRPFISVSDISLRTKPSRLPPPSRPPPALTVNKGECDRTNSKLKASKSYAFERVADNDAPLFFDVEIDANLSFEGTKHGNTNVNKKHDCTKESIERKDFRSHTKCHSEDVTNVEEKMNKIIDLRGDKRLESHGKDRTGSAPYTEDGIESIKSIEKFPDSRRGQHSDQIPDISAGPVAWTEAAEYFEVVEKNISREPFKTVDESEAYNLKKESKKIKVTKEALIWDEKRNQHEMTGDDFDWANKRRTKNTNTRLSDQKDFQENVMLNKLPCVHNSNRTMPENLMQSGKSGKPQIDHGGSVDRQVEAKCNVNEVEEKIKSNSSFKLEIEKNQKRKENYRKHEENIVKEECQRRLENLGRAEIRERGNERTEHEGVEKQQNGDCGNKNENMMKGSLVPKKNEIKNANEHGESGKKSYIAGGQEKRGDEQLPLEVNKDKERHMVAGKQKFNELTFGRAFEQAGDDKEQELAPEWEVMKERCGDASIREDSSLRVRKAETEPGNKGEICQTKAYKHLGRDASSQELSGDTEETEPIERNRHDREVNPDLESNVPKVEDRVEVLDGAYKLDKGTASKVAEKHDNTHILERTQAAFSCEGNMELKTQPSGIPNESESRTNDPLVKCKFNKLEDGDTQTVTNNTVESPSSPKRMTNSNIGGIGMGSMCVMPEKTVPSTLYSHDIEKIISYEDDREQRMKGTEVIIEEVDIRDSSYPCQVIRESVVNGRKVEEASSVLEHNKDSLHLRKISRNQNTERKDKNMKENLAAKDHKVGVRIRREIELENEHLRKIEEEREREREREKDRMAVDKAALESCERSYVEARERAERAAVERATAEVRQRVTAEARERLEKASMEARLRTERAAVERATVEARQRAAEKLMAEKSIFDARERVEKSVFDRFSASSRFADTKQSSFSSDLHFKNTGISHGLRQTYFSAHAGSEGESPQRCKARLERYRRTAERSANALAEKNRRDLLAQKEREERNRVAEALDAEVKRWSSGKEGNLRALLSTLQYILGPDSGWQPVPLTEVITSTAVKKAYRKATLCVHPDKLQQRGATIQQKYMCEKVFDLLKEAWNKFNSEER